MPRGVPKDSRSKLVDSRAWRKPGCSRRKRSWLLARHVLEGEGRIGDRSRDGVGVVTCQTAARQESRARHGPNPNSWPRLAARPGRVRVSPSLTPDSPCGSGRGREPIEPEGGGLSTSRDSYAAAAAAAPSPSPGESRVEVSKTMT